MNINLPKVSTILFIMAVSICQIGAYLGSQRMALSALVLLIALIVVLLQRNV